MRFSKLLLSGLIAFIVLVLSQGMAGAQSIPSNVTLVDANSSCSGAGCDGTTWAKAFKTIQEGVDEASGSSGTIDEVWVAGGTYTPASSNAAVVTMAAGVAIYGGFKGESGSPSEWLRSQRVLGSEESILDGDWSGNGSANATDSDHVVIGASNAVLDGFTVKNGYADGSAPDYSGGGLYSLNLSNLIISNCLFKNNIATTYGGGIYNKDSTLTILDTVISSNSSIAAGGMYHYQSTGKFLTMDGAVFYNNAASTFSGGGGLFIWQVDGTATGTTISNTSFISNSSVGYGAGILHGGNGTGNGPTLTNVSFYDNIQEVGTSDRGNGIYGNGPNSSLQIRNSAFYDASGTYTTIEIGNIGTYSTVTYSCGKQDFYTTYGSTNTSALTSNPFTTSDLIGEGNADFGNMDGINELYLVQSSNPCLDLGSDAYATSAGIDWTNLTTSTSGTLDADSGDGVSTGTDVDAGRHYFGSLSVIPPPAYVTLVDANSSCSGAACDGTTWAKAFKTVQEGVDEASGSSGTITEVWTAGGTYTPASSNAAVVTMANSIAIYGGFEGESGTPAEGLWSQRVLGSEESILDGDWSGNGSANATDSDHVVIGASNAILDGFTVKNGYADGSNPNDSGGGLYSTSLTNLTVSNCLFENNEALGVGGGIYNKESILTVLNTVFSANSSTYGAGLYHYQSTGTFLTMDGSAFDNNAASSHGGGVYIVQSDGNATGTTISNTSFNSNNAVYGAGGMSHSGNGTGNGPTLTNLSFYNNYESLNGTGSGLLGGGPNSSLRVENSAFYNTGGVSPKDIFNIGTYSVVTHSCGKQNFNTIYGSTNTTALTSSPFTTSDLIGEGNAGLDNTDGINELYLVQSNNPCVDLGLDSAATSTGIDWTNLTTDSSGSLDADSGDGVSTGTDVDAGRHYEPAP